MHRSRYPFLQLDGKLPGQGIPIQDLALIFEDFFYKPQFQILPVLQMPQQIRKALCLVFLSPGGGFQILQHEGIPQRISLGVAAFFDNLFQNGF